MGHLNLILIFLIPVCVSLVLLRLDERLGPRAFTLLLALALLLWQAQTGMYFRMAEGYLGPIVPEEFKRWPVVKGFYARSFTADDRRELWAFLRAHHVRTIIVAERALGSWPQVFAAIDAEPIRAGGVLLYKMPRGPYDVPRGWQGPPPAAHAGLSGKRIAARDVERRP